MSRAVLDASAVLVLLQQEPGAERVAAHVAEGVIGAVNLAEVLGKLIEAGMPETKALRAVEGLALEVVPFDGPMAARAGALRPLTRAQGLSLGDRACLATALELDLPVVTADRTWGAIELAVPIELVR